MPTSTTQTRHRKIRAVLAGGLVLGIGGAVTLAAWNDSEFAQGTFTAGTFNLEGSTTSATTGFDDHDSVDDSGDGAAELNFTLPADNLAPGDVVYAPFWVRLAAGTTSPATLAATDVDATGENVSNISYQVLHIAADGTCDSGASGPVVAAGGALDALNPDGASVDLVEGPDTETAGDAEQLCFVVTADPTLSQSEGATATWQFTATSTSD